MHPTRSSLLALRLVATVGIVACGEQRAPLAPPGGGIVVSGTVRDRAGEPISGANVLVPGKEPVTTAADGRFSLSGIATPYDIAVFVSSQNTAVTYNGVTRSDPSLIGAVNPTGTEHVATISGTAPPTSGKATTMFFNSGPDVGGSANADPTTGRYTITVRWHGATTSYSGQLHLLQWTRSAPTYIAPSGLPYSYDGYASKPVTITAGGTLSGIDFAATELTDPPEQTIAGTVAPPPGYTLTSRDFILSFGNTPTLAWRETRVPNVYPGGIIPLAFTYTAPLLSGVTFGVDATAQDFGWSYLFKTGIPGNSTGVVVPLEPAPQLLSPADGAAAIDVTTPFSWSQSGGAGVNVLAAIPDSAFNPTFFVFTTAPGATIPNLSGAGVTLPPGASYHWHVDRIFPLASVDQAAGDGYLGLVNGETGDVGETVSQDFAFTTKTAASLRSQVVSTAPAVRPNNPRGFLLLPGRLHIAPKPSGSR